MRPAPPQRELFVRPAPSSDTVFVNDRVCFQTEEKQRVVFVHGVIFSHYAIEDRTAEAYAMVLLFESGYADQNDSARCFGYSARSLRRYQERLKIGGLSALARPEGRPSGSSARHKRNHERDRTILRLKAKGRCRTWCQQEHRPTKKNVKFNAIKLDISARDRRFCACATVISMR